MALFKSGASGQPLTSALLSRLSSPFCPSRACLLSHASPACTMPVKGGSKCIKYLLFGFNFIFWVSERRLSRAPLRGHLFSGPGRRPGRRVSGRPRARGAAGTARARRTPGEKRKAQRLPAGRAGLAGGREGGKWVGEPRVLVAPAVHFAPGSFCRRVFEMVSVPAPTRSTPECERGGREERRNLFE